MRMILLTISLIVVAAPSYAAQKPSLEKRCQDLVGKEDRRRRRAKPRRPVPGATLQRLHDGRAALV